MDDRTMKKFRELILMANSIDIVEPKNNVVVQYPEFALVTTDIINRDLPLQKSDVIDIKFRKDKKPISIRGKTSEGVSTFTPEHFMYLEGIYRLYDKGFREFSPSMIYRYSVGDQDASTTPARLKRMERHIDELRTTLVYLEITDYAEAFKKHYEDADIERGIVIDNTLLHLERTRVFVQGVETTGYKILSKPVLFRLAEQMEQLGQVEWELLKEPKGTSVNDGLINNYLVKRIAAMRNTKNRMDGRKILLDTIYRHIGKEDATAKQKRTIREKATATLDKWEELEFIKGYSILVDPSSKRKRGFEIEL